MFNTTTPSTLEILEDARLKTRLAELGRKQRETAEGLKDQHLSDEAREAERFQYESNALAESSALYAAARSASASFLVVPLEPLGTRPLVDTKEATNDPRRLYEWWSSPELKDSNPGVALGRKGGILALRVEGDGYRHLRAMATVERSDDNDRTWREYRDLPRYEVRLVKRSNPVSMRSVIGWGKTYEKAVRAMDEEDERRDPQTFFLAYSYHSVVSGLDAWDFKRRTVLPGVTLMGEGDVLPWQGSILDGGIQVVAPMNKPPEVPIWLAQAIGKPRSRKAMAAQREGFESALRVDEAHVIGVAEARRLSAEAARRLALADVERAAKALEEAES